jgi:hypothetical protein
MAVAQVTEGETAIPFLTPLLAFERQLFDRTFRTE